MIDKDARNDVLIGFADNGAVATCFMTSMLEAFSEDALRGKERRMGEYYFGTGPYIHDNRARIARYFLECTGKQWLWMLDNDIKFPPDALYQLLDAAEEHDCKILGAAYWNQYPGTNCYLSWLQFTPKGIYAVENLPEDSSKPMPVTAVGMGCTLIHRSVFEAVVADYPNDPWDTFAADLLVQFEDGGFLIGRVPDDFDQEVIERRKVAGTQRMGEDVTFCIRAQKAGFQTYGLPSLTVDHYKPHFMNHGNSGESVKMLNPDLVGVM